MNPDLQDEANQAQAQAQAGQQNAGRRHKGSKKAHKGKRHGNASLRAWVTFVKKVQKEEGIGYKEAMSVAKRRKDKGEKWRGGGEEENSEGLFGGEPEYNESSFGGEPEEASIDGADSSYGGRKRRRHRTQRRSRSHRRSSRRSRSHKRSRRHH
jgi:hypothetical protein